MLLAALLWGTTGTAQTFAPAGATPLTVGALRLAVGGGALWLTVIVGHRLRRRGSVAPDADDTIGWHPGLLASALGAAGYQLAFFAGVDRTGVAAGTLVTIGSAPLWAGLLEMMLLKERPAARWVAATAAAVAGSALLMGGAGETAVDFGGVLLNLTAGASFALYTVGNKAALQRFPGRSTDIAAASLAGGGLLMVPILVAADVAWVMEPNGLAVVFHLGVVATAAAYALFGRGLATVSAASATTLTLAEPLTAAVLGVTVLGERLGPAGFGGAVLVFAGLLLLAVGEGSAQVPDAAEGPDAADLKG